MSIGIMNGQLWYSRKWQEEHSMNGHAVRGDGMDSVKATGERSAGQRNVIIKHDMLKL